MKYRVERCIECTRAWVVLDTNGRVVHETSVWQWAVDDAVARHRADVDRAYRAFILERIA